MNRSTCLAAIVAVGVGPLAAAQDDAKTIMNDVLGRYAEFTSYAHIATEKLDIDFGDAGAGMMMGGPPETRVTFNWDHTGRFAIIGGQLVDFYADGKSAVTHTDALHQFTKTEIDGRSIYMSLGKYGPMITEDSLVTSILLDSPASADEFRHGVTEWGEVTALDNGDTQIAFTLPARRGGEPTEGWIVIDQDTGLIKRDEIDLMASFAASGQPDPGGMEPTRARRVVEYASVATNVAFDDSVFTFTPGDDDELVDELPGAMEIMQATMGGMGMPEPVIGEGDAAPDVKATTLDGQPFDLADLKGKVVLIDFWATWCKPCMMAMPGVVAIYEQFKDKDVVVVGINQDRPGHLDKVREAMKEQNITFVQIHDKNGAIGEAFGVRGIPHGVLIDRTGTISAVHVGYAPGAEKKLAEEIEKLLESDL